MSKEILNIGLRPAINIIRETLGEGLIGAEIGVNKGYLSSYICQIINPKALYLIDPCANYVDQNSGEIIGESQYIIARGLLKNNPCCHFIKETSFEAAEKIQNGSLDFVYIDAEHTEMAVLSDALRWYPKVRKGGILSGHDFTTQSVHDGVKAFCAKMQIINVNSAA